MTGRHITLSIDQWREVYRRSKDETIRKTIVSAVEVGCLTQWFPEHIANEIETILEENWI